MATEVERRRKAVAIINQCKFLGFTFYDKKLVWHDKAFQQFKHRIKEITGRSGGRCCEEGELEALPCRISMFTGAD